jgi:hypothetical protein
MPSPVSDDYKHSHPLASAVVMGVVAFLAGTCIIQGAIMLVISVASKSLYVSLLERSPANPFWTPWWGFWCFYTVTTASALLIAVVFAKQTYRNARRKAEGLPDETCGAPPVVQFSIKSLLLLQFYLASGLGLICWLGRPIVPCVFGVFGAMIGYGTTLFLGRRRLIDVIVAYLLGIVIASLFLTFHTAGLSRLQEEALNERVRQWIILTTPLVFPVVAAVARWRLKKKKGCCPDLCVSKNGTVPFDTNKERPE